MKMLVGLGNPGGQYAATRHNVGFMAIEHIAKSKGTPFKGKFQSELGEITLAEEKVILLKPQTFMNLSGRAVREAMNWYKLTHEDIVIIYDDMDLPFGKIRLREQGSPGGHNGIKSLIAELGTQNFPRVRVGIGRPPQAWDPADYVLGNFSAQEHSELPQVLDNIQQAVLAILSQGFVKAMNTHNR
ncbi:MAG TPA: aminoacyl-tRNA hydrolase [Candidatus Deferrimicrobium sp.]|nr:aminoacyl-tRNA hydrolase [Candidatus Deferrimicrobium sp.]